jgi:hypothetical protein
VSAGQKFSFSRYLLRQCSIRDAATAKSRSRFSIRVLQCSFLLGSAAPGQKFPAHFDSLSRARYWAQDRAEVSCFRCSGLLLF